MSSLAYLAITTALMLIGTILLMMPVSWVYMSARQIQGHNQSVVQTLIILPLVVAGIVLIVRDSLALAFSLAGVVAAVRFRISLRDTRDVVFIFLSIAVGFAAGVQTGDRRGPYDRFQPGDALHVALRLRAKRPYADGRVSMGRAAQLAGHGERSRRSSRPRSRSLAHPGAGGSSCRQV